MSHYIGVVEVGMYSCPRAAAILWQGTIYHCTNVNDTDNRFKPQLQPPIVNSFGYYPVN
jgi:hypothetical protein